jgi:uncharacterized phage protein (TIGR02220 family)
MTKLRALNLRGLDGIWSVVGLSCQVRGVFSVIVKRVNEHGESWPSLALMTMETGLSIASVQRGIHELVNLGLLTKRRVGRRQANTYRVNIDRLEAMPQAAVIGPTEQSPPPVIGPTDAVIGPTDQGDWSHRPTNRLIEQIQEQKNPPTPHGGVDSALDWIMLLNSATGATFTATKANLQHPRQRIREGFTLDQAAVVVKAKVREWTGTEWAKFLRPATIYGTKFDSYLQAARNGHGRDPRRVNDEWKETTTR